jgi:hypothetical protein
MWLNPNHPSMAHLVACNYPKCNCKLGSMEMDEIFYPNHKVYDYIFNFKAMSCFLWLNVLWHLSKAIKLFLIACVHYNYKWVANSVLDFQISSNEVINQNIHTQLCMNVKTHHHHMNYLKLDYSIFLTYICFK